MAMNGNDTGTVEYSTVVAFNSNLPNIIVFKHRILHVRIRQFDSAHVKWALVTNLCSVGEQVKRSFDYQLQVDEVK